VVIRDYNRWTDQGQTNIPVFDYEQMSGRAGRPGFDTEGHSYLIAKTYEEAFNLDEFYVHGEIEVTNSKLIDNDDAVLKQIITQVSSGFAKDIDELIEFFNKTFYGFQISHTYNTMSYGFSDESIKYEISSALEYLIQNGIIRLSPSGLQTTPFGTLISKNNYAVKTAVKLKDYSNMMGDEFNIGSLIYEISRTHDMPKINTKFKANKDNIKEVLSKHDVYVSFVQNNEATAASLIEWINEHKEYEIGKLVPLNDVTFSNVEDYLTKSLENTNEKVKYVSYIFTAENEESKFFIVFADTENGEHQYIFTQDKSSKELDYINKIK
jgi:helicase